MDKYRFSSDPVADPAATVTGSQYRFTLIGDTILRFEWASDGVFEDRASTFAINRRAPPPRFEVKESDQQLEIITPTLHLIYDKQRFSPNGLRVSFGAKVTVWGAEWRYGSADAANLGGTARTLDKVDGRCDVGAGVLSRSGYAVLDDSQSMLFDGAGFVAPRRPGDRVDGYLFCYGHDYVGAMRAFYAISGPQPRIPRWALGNWWSRFHRYTADNYLALMDRFRDQSIPLSVAVIDMDWHLVDDERVPHAGWTGYTWNESLFPDPAAFGQALHNRGLKITLNDHPHSGIHHHEALYQAIAKQLGHDTATQLPITFDPTCPRFMHAWLNVLHRLLEKQACDFWWIDWQQGSFSRVPGLDPLWLLNHFHFLDNSHQAADGRGMIFSRYAGPGSHRYPVGFSGDTIVTWESLRFQPEFTATAANIGYGWWSHDIGGHMHGYRDDELATRWVQLGVFSPILRLHSSDSPWASKEPWLYRPEHAAAMTRALQLRHRLVPYIYSSQAGTSSADAAETLPLVRPMYWVFPSRAEAYAFPNQYAFGPNLVAAPVVHPRDIRTGRAKVKVWVPPGRHVDVFSGCVYDGDRELDMYRTLDRLPVLAPEGAIVPLDASSTPPNGCPNPDAFEVLVVVGQDGWFRIVEDRRDDARAAGTVTTNGIAGAGRTDRVIEIEFDQAAGRLTVDNAADRQWTFRFVSLCATRGPHVSVLVDGVKLAEPDEVAISVDTSSMGSPPGLVVKLPKLPEGAAIDVYLSPKPRLTVWDHQQAFRDMLLDLQAEFAVKDAIWKIAGAAHQAASVKLARLLSLGLDEALIGPVVELLACDGRASGASTGLMVNGIK